MGQVCLLPVTLAWLVTPQVLLGTTAAYILLVSLLNTSTPLLATTDRSQCSATTAAAAPDMGRRGGALVAFTGGGHGGVRGQDRELAGETASPALCLCGSPNTVVSTVRILLTL